MVDHHGIRVAIGFEVVIKSGFIFSSDRTRQRSQSTCNRIIKTPRIFLPRSSKADIDKAAVEEQKLLTGVDFANAATRGKA